MLQPRHGANAASAGWRLESRPRRPPPHTHRDACRETAARRNTLRPRRALARGRREAGDATVAPRAGYHEARRCVSARPRGFGPRGAVGPGRVQDGPRRRQVGPRRPPELDPGPARLLRPARPVGYVLRAWHAGSGPARKSNVASRDASPRRLLDGVPGAHPTHRLIRTQATPTVVSARRPRSGGSATPRSSTAASPWPRSSASSRSARPSFPASTSSSRTAATLRAVHKSNVAAHLLDGVAMWSLAARRTQLTG